MDSVIAVAAPDDTAEAWERHALEWIRWADRDHADGFWTVTWPAVERLLPDPARGPVADIGCGEGRGSRKLSDAGYQVVGVDRSPTLARRSAALGGRVAIGDATRLPLRSRSLGIAVACMSLMDIDDLPGVVAEIDRVLRRDGVLVAAIVHPAISAFDATRLRAGSYVAAGSYLEPRRYVDRAERDGWTMTFTSWHRPLHAYVDALSARGFAMTRVVEDGDGDLPWLFAFRAVRSDLVSPVGL